MGKMSKQLAAEVAALTKEYPVLKNEEKAAFAWGAERRICWATAEECQRLANKLHEDGSGEFSSTIREIKQKFSATWKFVTGGLDPTNRYPDGSLRQGA